MTSRAGTMRLACMFSSILLFGAAGLLLFISLQDPSELAPQQVPGEPVLLAPPPCPTCETWLPWSESVLRCPAGRGGVLARSWQSSASVWERCV